MTVLIEEVATGVNVTLSAQGVEVALDVAATFRGAGSDRVVLSSPSGVAVSAPVGTAVTVNGPAGPGPKHRHVVLGDMDGAA